MRQKKLVAIVLLVLLAMAINANAGYPGYGHQVPEHARVVQMGLQKLTKYLTENPRSERPPLRLFLEREIVPYFDFEYMARWAGGPRWRYMSPKQRIKMREALKRRFLETLVQRLSQYGGQGFRLLPARRGQNRDFQVNVAITNARGYPTRLKFRMYRKGKGWKVFDVVANGNSAVMHYRRHFNARFAPGGCRGRPGCAE